MLGPARSDGKGERGCVCADVFVVWCGVLCYVLLLVFCRVVLCFIVCVVSCCEVLCCVLLRGVVICCVGFVVF